MKTKIINYYIPWLLFILWVGSCTLGCKTTRHVTQSRIKTDSTTVVKSDSSGVKKSSTVTTATETKKDESKDSASFSAEFQFGKDSIIIIDSSKGKIVSKGDAYDWLRHAFDNPNLTKVTVKGTLVSTKTVNTLKKDSTSTAKVDTSSKHANTDTHLVKDEKNKEVTKTTTMLLPWWVWLILVAVALGALYYFRKKIPFISKLLPFLLLCLFISNSG